MAQLTADQVTGYARAAGFSGGDLRVIVAIAQAESDFETTAHNPGNAAIGDVEDSWGLWQINRLAHPQVTVAQAQDPTFAAQYSYSLYKAAGGFRDWGTYTSGAYKDTSYWKSGANPGAVQLIPNAPWTPADSRALWAWLTPDGRTLNSNNPYHSAYEAARGAVQDGIGIGTPLDTLITSLTSGTVMASAQGQDLAPKGQNWNYGGFIIIRSQLTGSAWTDVFYRHMDTLEVKKGDTVVVGQRLGLSGGQAVGGSHPESSAFTSGPHIDVGLNPSTLPYTSIGPNRDPTAWLASLLANGPPTRDRLHLIIGGVGAGTAIGGATATLGVGAQNAVLLADQVASGTGGVADSFLSIEQRMDAGLAIIPIDWSTASAGTHWWDYALPWQWQKTQNTVAANITTAIVHDVEAVSLRALLVVLGAVIILAVMFGITNSVNQAAIKTVEGGSGTALPRPADLAQLAEVAA